MGWIVIGMGPQRRGGGLWFSTSAITLFQVTGARGPCGVDDPRAVDCFAYSVLQTPSAPGMLRSSWDEICLFRSGKAMKKNVVSRSCYKYGAVKRNEGDSRPVGQGTGAKVLCRDAVNRTTSLESETCNSG